MRHEGQGYNERRSKVVGKRPANGIRTKGGLDSNDRITPLACEDISRRVRVLQLFTYWNAEASSGASATRLAGSRRSSRS